MADIPTRISKNRMPTVGDRIKDRRNELGWSQDVLSQKAGISKSFLSDLENGRRHVSAKNLLDIARVLNLSMDFLMTGAGVEPIAKPNAASVQIPASLAAFAESAELTFTQALALLRMREQIQAHRSATKKETAEKIDWQKFYEAVKDFLE